ncbi:hypothetical protein ACHAWU_000830 [Discostella pseudostelligera]|uniref:Methyltransferase domain-containing protein n=1 Tax=Discostella pseudostelligera TaxID=259834 RepID=A0ABD3MC80_9STRA
MMLNYSAGRPRFLDLLVLLGLIIGIFVYTENSVPGFSTFSTRLAQHSTISTTTCDERLDELDRTFNRRRDARIELIDINKAEASYDLYEPEAVCFSEERFGSTKRYTAYGDGPKFICGVDVIAEKSNSSEGCLVYSVGSNNRIGFEVGISNFMGCETHTFDPTLNKPFVGNKYATFHPWGLGNDGAFMVEEKAQLDRNEHGGCEWDALPPLFNAIAAGEMKVDQVLVEVHFPPSEAALAAVFLAADKAKLRVFHKERNSWGVANCCVEYAFVSQATNYNVMVMTNLNVK